MGDEVTSLFDSRRINPFQFKYIKTAASLAEALAFSSPKLVLASSPDCASGFAAALLPAVVASPSSLLLLTRCIPYIYIYICISICIYRSMMLASSPDCASGFAAALRPSVVASPSSLLLLTRCIPYIAIYLSTCLCLSIKAYIYVHSAGLLSRLCL